LGHAALFRSLVELARPRNAEARNAMSHGLVLAARMRTRAGLGDAGFSRYLEGTRNTLRQRVRDWLTVPGEVSESARIQGRLATDWPELADPAALDLNAWRSRLPVLNERLLAETWSKTHGVSNKNIEALIRLAQSGGDPESFFSAVGHYVESLAEGASPELLDRIDGQLGAFHDLTRDLRTALDSPIDLVVTPAASRGIAYYTGITFEIHTAATRTAYSNVCGGGRYSGLHRWLYERASHTAALRRGEVLPTAPLNRDISESLTGVGFAYGIERLDAALQDQNAKRPRPDVYVVVEDAAFVRRAFHTASRLRSAGLAVICELPTARYTVRDLQVQLAAARRAGGRGARHALIFGTADDRQGHVSVTTLDSGTQQTLHLAEAEAWLLAQANPGARP
jgi:ATP phosphoribosyltransferase regulatory subunit HisZ